MGVVTRTPTDEARRLLGELANVCGASRESINRYLGGWQRRGISGGCNSLAELKKQLEARTRELAEAREHLAEALEQQTATSEVLQVISSFPGDLEPVFQSVLEKATRICNAQFGNLYLCEGDAFRIVAMHGAAPRMSRLANTIQLFDRPGLALGRVAITKQLAHIADIKTTRSYISGIHF